ncbi:MAG: RsmE family RNA methyltransferase [Candidatus Gastranaerophilaceae bacterium]|jgi:16S rRNA (uracil1498-N3)-methyltransferase
MPQFFIKSTNINENEAIISEKEDIKHILNVLRYRINDELILVDEDEFAYKVIITDIQKNSITTKVIEKVQSFRKLSLNITLAQSILKASAQDILIQKTTELGVKTIVPIVSRYTVVKFNNKKDMEQKIKRWQKIAFESCKQCERSDIPVVADIISIESLLNIVDDYDLAVVCVERNADMSIKEFLKVNKPFVDKNLKILAIVGPEGGWSDEEICMFQGKNLKTLTLGNLIFRAETAALNVLSDIIYEYEL